MAVIEKRKTKEGEIAYRVKIRLKGFPIQTATFKRLTDARRWEQQTEAAIREGRHFKAQEAKRHTLTEAIDRYITDILPQKKAAPRQLSQYQWWKKQLGHLFLIDITPVLLAKSRDDLTISMTPREKLKSAATVNRYLAALSHLFSVAIREWGWIENNPLRKVNKLKEPRGRVRFLSEEERTHLLTACKNHSPYLHLIVVLALATGARKMEILGLQWKDIDLQRGMITLHETKNGERRSIPLTGYPLKLMHDYAKQFIEKDVNWIFPSKRVDQPIDIRKAWNATLNQAGISNFRFHDLRHSAASYLAMNGATLAEIAEVLGHKTLQMVKRYTHLSDSHISKVVAKMNANIFNEIV